MKKQIRILLLCAALLLFSGCGTGGSSPESDALPTLRIGMMSSSDVIPYVLMEERGLADEHGFELKLEVFTSAKDRDAAFQAGELDGVLTDYIGICIYQNAGFDVKITGITDGDYILMAGKDTGITDLSEIKGRSIAISENTLIEYSLDTILEEHSMADTDVVKEVVSRIPDRLELLRSGQIDLGLMPEPFATLGLSDGAVKLGTANECGLYPAVSAFSKKALEEKGDAVRNLYKAYQEAVDYMNSTDIREYEETVIRAVGYPEEMVGKVELKPFRSSHLPPEEDVAAAVDWASEKGLCSADLSYDQLTWDAYSDS